MASLLSYALCTVSDVKESLGIASSVTTYDNLITRKINQATLAIENYCGRRFALTTYTDEVYNASGTDQLVLKQRPITALTAYGSRDTPLNDEDWDEIDTDLYFYDSGAGLVNGLFNSGHGWSRYRVTYSAGYATIPEDLAEACATLACFYFNNSNATSVGVTKKKEGQREVNYSSGNTSLSFENILAQLGIDVIINNYANFPLAKE